MAAAIAPARPVLDINKEYSGRRVPCRRPGERDCLWQLGCAPYDGLPATPRLRANRTAEMPYAVSLRYWGVAAPSTHGRRAVKQRFPLSDEPFPIRDIQFDHP